MKINVKCDYRKQEEEGIIGTIPHTSADHLPVSRLAALCCSNSDLLLSPTGELGAVAADMSKGLSPAGADVLSRASTPPGGKSDGVGSYCEWARSYCGERRGMSTGWERDGVAAPVAGGGGCSGAVCG